MDALNLLTANAAQCLATITAALIALSTGAILLLGATYTLAGICRRLR